MSDKRDAIFGEGVSDADLQREYGIGQEGADLIVDGGAQTSRYEGKQQKPQTTNSKPGAAENGGGGY